MANLTKETDWTSSVSQTVKNKAYTFNTSKKYVDRNIKMNLEVPGMNLQNGETFYINDGINTWNWAIDASGNVTIT